MMDHHTTNSRRLVLLAFFLGALGGFLLSNLTRPVPKQQERAHRSCNQIELENDDVLLPPSGFSTSALSSMENGLYSLMEYSDSDLHDVFYITLAFDDDTAERLKVEGFERFEGLKRKNDTVAMHSLVFYLANSTYHSLQLFHAHDNATGEDSFDMSLHGDGSYDVLTSGNPKERRLFFEKASKPTKGKVMNDMRQLFIKKAFNKVKNTGKKGVNAASSSVSKLEGEVKKLKDKAKKLTKEVTKLKNKISKLQKAAKKAASKFEKEMKSMAKKLEKATKFIKSLPDKIDDIVVEPIVKDIKKAEDGLKKIDDIAKTVAKSTIKVIKDLPFLPSSGDELGKFLAKGFKDFIGGDFCIPYDCIAKLVGIDFKGVELADDDGLSIGTGITPKSCLRIAEIEFDTSKLADFLDIFKNLEALEEIFEKVYDFIEDQMKQILGFSDEILGVLEDIEGIAKDAYKEIKKLIPNRRRLVKAETGDEVTMEEASAIAYQEGVAKFHELWGEHVKQVFQDRQLEERGAQYIGFEKLVLEVKQDFGQTFYLETSGRRGYADSVFDESIHQTATVPVPLTGGMVKIVASGSMKASMPYAMAMEAQASAEFGYNLGEITVSVDLVEGKIDFKKKEFKTSIDVDASVGVSASMSLNFAVSTSLGLCLGPTEDACITVAVDAGQTSAAGFDAVASVGTGGNPHPLTTMYTDVLEYEEQPSCDNKQLSLKAGYWQYVMSPWAVVSITGKAGCIDESAVLFEIEADVLQDEIDSFCLSTNII
ncbi:expressed unknown protein [Seminavis robusta]|uniref:Uncharacterized protein n=1 Tax=Seminavis robusta TaxID=568900 RepID=A0A9N8DT15_9STRA|nr:expressed unknown protein [Seminavis robusta]|eukprot:Sro350_g123720.1 n/a (765) ;mRNA; f:38004-40397